LSAHAKKFVSGRYINAHSTIGFCGTTADLNALLSDVAAIDGAKILVRFSTGRNNLVLLSDSTAAADPPRTNGKSSNGWGDAQYLLITIIIGDDKIKVEEVQLPMVSGLKTRMVNGVHSAKYPPNHSRR
jgi:hypothetical protein